MRRVVKKGNRQLMEPHSGHEDLETEQQQYSCHNCSFVALTTALRTCTESHMNAVRSRLQAI